MRRLLVGLCALVVFGAIALPGASARPEAAAGPGGNGRGAGHLVDLQILALNDFHGNLLSPGNLTVPGGTPTPAGGVDVLATMIRNERATNPNSVFVSAGDLIGASPLISALFHDEPTIEAMNLLDLDFNAVGNHEFDDGAAELQRMQDGGCHPVDGCQDGDGFDGADFQFLAANVTNEASGDTIFPPYGIVRFEHGVRVAFIGMTLEGTPGIVTPSGVEGLAFHDEADTVNALVDRLSPQADLIVVLVHEGGSPSAPDFNSCPGVSGPIVDIVNRTSDEVDLFITGHTHAAYNCVIDGRPVTSSLSFGRLFTDIDITYDHARKQIVSVSIENIPVLRVPSVPPAVDVVALVAEYDTLSAPLRNRVIGSISADLVRAQNAAGESPLGDVIADSQLAATSAPAFGGAVAAFMNPGGIRTDLLAGQISGGEQPGQVTYGEAFSVQPFGNSLVTMTLTGAQIDLALEQQFNNPAAPARRMLQVSHGFAYTWSLSAPVGSKVSNITINGVPVDPNGTYRITVNSFLADGGDNFFALRSGTERLGGAQDIDAQAAYLAANAPVAPPTLDRITQVP